jgi:hypothetical protein
VAQQRLSTLADVFKADFEVVANPDHPLLFEAPDLLIAKPDNLVAVFVPHNAEQSAPGNLLARLTAARLALPADARSVLVPTDSAPWLTDDIASQFSEVIRSGKNKELASFAADKKAWGNSRPVPLETRARAFHQYQLLLDLSSADAVRQWAPHRKKRPTTQPDTPPKPRVTSSTHSNVVEELIADHEYQPAHQTRWLHQRWQFWPRNADPIARRDESVVAAVPARSRASAMEQVRPYCRAMLKLTYGLDQGIPYRQDNLVSILLIPELKEWSADPGKPFRSAAFAGWALADYDSPSSLLEYTDYLSTTLKKEAW